MDDQIQRRAAAIDEEKDRAVAYTVNGRIQIVLRGDALVINFLNHVTTLESGIGCHARRINAGNHHAARSGGQIKLLSNFRRQRLHLHAVQRGARR